MVSKTDADGRIDAAEAVAFLRGLPARSVGAMITDPPFFVSPGRDGKGFGDDPWVKGVKSVGGVEAWSRELAKAAAHAIRPGGACVMLGSAQSLGAWHHQASRHGFVWRASLAVLWNTGKPRRSNFGGLFTEIMWMAREGARHTWSSDRQAIYSNVLVCDKIPLKDRMHVTQKPIEITNFLISLLTRPDDMVVDPFCGAGSTLVSAELAGRRWAGCDLDKDCVEVARQRMDHAEDEEQGELRLWINGREEPL